MSKTIKVTVADGIYSIALNRPEQMNTFNDVMALELLRAFEEAQMLKEVRVIHLTGEGKAFCAGGDISFFANTSNDKMSATVPRTIEVLNTLITTMVNSSKPILTVVHGAVAGVGLSFALASDLVIAAAETQFTMAYSHIGLTPDGGATYWLPRIVGQRRALQLILLSERFSAADAEKYGIVNWIVPANEVAATTQKILKTLNQGPGVAYRLAKNLLNRSPEATLETQLNNEKHAFVECSLTEDFQEGITAFLEKRKANFKGK